MNEFAEYERFRYEPKSSMWLTFTVDIAMLGAILSLAYLIYRLLAGLLF